MCTGMLIKLKSHRSSGSDVHVFFVLFFFAHRTCKKKKMVLMSSCGFKIKLFRRQTDLMSRSEFITQLCLTGLYLEFIYV